MPTNEATVLRISCDNPKCPGNKLDPADRAGWLFVTAEVYGDPTTQHVFCSAKCVSAATADPATAADFGFTHKDPESVEAVQSS